MKRGLTEALILPPDLAEVRKLVLAGLHGYRAAVYLFGSWASGKAGRASDIDVAVLPLEPIPRHLFSKIREVLEESCVIYKVDLVDLSDASAEFRSRILSEGVLWSE
jgi:uncharacterized protein